LHMEAPSQKRRQVKELTTRGDLTPEGTVADDSVLKS
jgi:hypothetical protein